LFRVAMICGGVFFGAQIACQPVAT
jgi:hypothetical protein